MASLMIRLIDAYSMVLVAYAIATWFPSAMSTPVGQFLYRLSRPYLDLFSRFIPSIGGIGFDVIIGVMLLRYLQTFLIRFL